jgi:hypothetical protein
MKHEEVVQMTMFTNLINKYKRITPKQFILAGVFAIALASAIGAGFASRGTSLAFSGECDDNAVMYCGASSAQDFCNELSDDFDGKNHGLKVVYGDSKVGLPFSECPQFANEAKEGAMDRNGNIWVNNEIVVNGAHSFGRQNYTNNGVPSTPITVGGQTFYEGTPAQRWSKTATQIPVLVWFNKDGVAKAIIMKPCGNPVIDYNKPSANCLDLKKYAVEGEKNTYQFSTVAEKDQFGLAQYVKFHYSYKDGDNWVEFATTTSPTEKTAKKTFTKATTVRVTIEVKFPGVGTRFIIKNECEEEVGVVKEEFLHVCEALIKTPIDTKTFRFNAIDKHSNNVTLVSADFTLDGSVTTKGVTTDDDKDGHFDKTYIFTDNVSHKVSAVINFMVDGKVVQSQESCVATTDKTPECKPNIPVGDSRCQELPHTGPAGTAGLFVGISAAGAAAHRLITSRLRGRRG